MLFRSLEDGAQARVGLQGRNRIDRDGHDFACSMEDGIGEQLSPALAFGQNHAREARDVQRAEHNDGYTDNRGDTGDLLALDPESHVGALLLRSDRFVLGLTGNASTKTIELVVQRLQADAEDLRRAPDVIDRLLAIEPYRRRIDGRQEVMHLHIHVMGGPRPWSKG